MPLEIILGIVAVFAVIVFGVVLSYANSEPQPVVAVPVTALKEEGVAIVTATPVSAVPVVPVAVASIETQVLEHKIQELEKQLEEREDLSSANDSLRFDNQSLKKELMETTEKYRALLTKYDGLKNELDAANASFIKEKEIGHEQLVQEVEDLRRTQDKLRELNVTITAKADMLQYELIKARAQATGYERISQNYQQQIEALMGKAKGNRVESHVTK